MQYRYKPSVTTSSGTWTGDTLNIFGGICTQILAKANTATTTFDLKIEDENGFEVRKFTNVVEIVNDLSKWSAAGVLTVTIENASADESFDFLIVVEE